MGRSTSYYDLRDALAKPGCAVCKLRVRDAERFLGGMLWEDVNDPGMRTKIRRARGFCREHAWQMVRHGASLGIAIITHDVLSSVIKMLEGARFQPAPLLSLLRVQESAGTTELVAELSPQAPCPACSHVESMETIYLSTLVETLLGDDGLLPAYRSSAGLCLPHFWQALGHVRDEEVFRALLDAQRGIWEGLAGELSEVIRKNDYRYRDEPWGEEGDSWLRALAAISGDRPMESK